MDTPLSLVAQQCMDLFYTDFKSNTDFFDLSDFILYSGNTLTGYYLSEYRQMKAEMRADRQEEVVAFSEGVLSEQVLEVKNIDGVLTSELECPVMSFPYDEQSTGIQQVLPTRSRDCQNLERSNINQIWQFKHLPITDRIFWYADGNEIKYFVNAIEPLNKVRVLYVPLVNKNMSVPSSLIDFVTTNTVMKMKQIAAGVVVRESLSGNQNKTLETEINKSDLR